MTYEETIEYIHSVNWRGSRLGLERTVELLSKMGEPHKKMKFIHVAGTNGKGSVSSMLSHILEASGYKVGLYTSPFILTFNERMQINNKNISNEELVEIISYIKPFAESMEDKPTEFELITAAAFEYFWRNRCDVVVLEVGMGGALDSTNVIEAPVLSVITAIGLDHTRELGSTFAEIAAAKAGIIKDNCPVLFYGNNTEAENVIRKVSKEKNAPLTIPDFSAICDTNFEITGLTMSYKWHKNVFVPLAGTFQMYNTAMVLEATDILKNTFPNVTEESIITGLSAAHWPARFEVISKDPYIILDGAHNPHGITAAVDSVKRYFPDDKIILIFGVMADKDYQTSVGIVAPITEKVFTVTPDNPRALPAADLADVFRNFGVCAESCESIEAAVKAAYREAKSGRAKIIASFGSLYMYADVRHAFENILS